MRKGFEKVYPASLEGFIYLCGGFCFQSGDPMATEGFMRRGTFYDPTNQQKTGPESG